MVWGRLASNVGYSSEQHSVSSCCWMAVLGDDREIPSSTFPQDCQNSQTRNRFHVTWLGPKYLTSNVGFLDFSPNTALGGGFCSELYCPESRVIQVAE